MSTKGDNPMSPGCVCLPKLTRRGFITRTAAASAGTAFSVRQVESAQNSELTTGERKCAVAGARTTLPTGKLGKLRVSRLISGGNLISGWAHSRDLQYLPSLMRAYNTEEKVIDTLPLLEEHGIHAI